MKIYLAVFVTTILTLLSPAVQAQDIIEAAKAGDLAQVMELVEGAPDLVNTTDETGRTPLHWAARGVHLEVLSYLIGKGANVNAQDINLVTPLHSVCSRGHVEAARVLIENKADVGATMFELSTPLHQAVLGDSRELVALLIENGAPLQKKNSKEDTPLHAAIHSEKWDVIETAIPRLSSSNVNGLDLADFDGNTVLHLACRAGRTETVKTIVSKMMNINQRNALGQSAYNIAVEEGFEEIADHLIQQAAETDPQRFPVLTGPYMSQDPPDTIPRLFAKGIVSTRIGMYGTIVFSPDGQEAFWKPGVRIMYYMKKTGDFWSAPQIFPFEGKINVPLYSIDGDRLYVMVQPHEEEEIWYFTKSGENWTGPQPLDSIVNSGPMHWQFSIDEGNNLYLSTQNILCAHFSEGGYIKPEPLPSPINVVGESQEQYREGNVGPCVSKDGNLLIFTKFSSDRKFPIQLYLSFRMKNGAWTEPQNLSQKLQTEGNDSAARITPDGKYLFFQSVRAGSGASRGLYWVSTKVIDELRPKM